MLLNFFKKLDWNHPNIKVMQNRKGDYNSDSQEKILSYIKHEIFDDMSIKSETKVLYYSGHGDKY